MRNEPVRLEIDYSLTLLRLSGTHTIAALDGNQRIADTGWCETRVNENGTAIELRCLRPGRMTHHCASAFLENTMTGRRNPDRFGCAEDYQPFFGRYKPVDAISRFGTNLPFRDITGLTKYPVDASQLDQSHIVIRTYSVEQHFTKHLVIPAIRLSEWTAQ